MKKLSIPMVVAVMEQVMGDPDKEDAYIQWLLEFFGDFDSFKASDEYKKAWSVRTDKLENVRCRMEYFLKAVE